MNMQWLGAFFEEKTYHYISIDDHKKFEAIEVRFSKNVVSIYTNNISKKYTFYEFLSNWK